MPRHAAMPGISWQRIGETEAWKESFQKSSEITFPYLSNAPRDRSGGIVTKVLHRRKGTSCPQQKGRQGRDLRQGNGDAHALDGFLHPLRKAQWWIRGIEGPRNHEGIIDADAHQNEGQDLLQHLTILTKIGVILVQQKENALRKAYFILSYVQL